MADRDKIPLLLLKTRSTPSDGYEEYFSTFDNGGYNPVFVPVLEHRFKQDSLDELRRCLLEGGFALKAGKVAQKYGAIILTSQRAVEAFSTVIEGIQSTETLPLDHLLPETTPFYVVGPATARGLQALNLRCPILGEETGNGDNLGAFIVKHYNGLYDNKTTSGKPPLLFLVGEKRRDVIPKTLQSDDLSPERRSKVDELVVYETGEMLSFRSEFSFIWESNIERGVKKQWVVVFSPTGCRAMLESLGLLDSKTGEAKLSPRSRNILIATIGPTTRDYLIAEFGFSPDVCAEKPSPEGIGQAITSFMNSST